MGATRIISRAEAGQLLNMAECIEVMEQTMKEISSGEVNMLQRSMMPVQGGRFAIMPGALAAQGVVGAKVIVFPAEGVKTAQGIVPLFNTATGELLAIVDGKGITGTRTASTTAVATRALAREDASALAILGAGGQGRLHIQSLCLVRGINSIFIWDRYPEVAQALARETAQAYGIHAVATDTAEQAVRAADIICTVTSATGIVLKGEWLRPGVHINAIGACAATARELDTAAVQLSRVFNSQNEACLRDGGDLVIPLGAGEIGCGHILGELGEVLLGRLAGRRSEGDITLFESVGLAVEDIAVARLIYEKALKHGVGVDVEI